MATNLPDISSFKNGLPPKSSVTDKPTTKGTGLPDISTLAGQAKNFGTAGINIGQLGRTKYDGEVNLGNIHNIEEIRSNAQGFWNKMGSGATRLALTTLTKTGAGVGYLGSLLANTGSELLDLEDNGRSLTSVITKSANNGISAMFNNIEDSIKNDLAPIYTSDAYRNGNLWEAMWTADFWASDVVDGLAFMASTYVPGGALAKLGMGSKAAGILGAAGRTRAGLEAGEGVTAMTNFVRNMRGLQAGVVNPLAAPKLAKLAESIDKVTMFSLMTSMEAMTEAKGTYDHLIELGVPKHIAEEKTRDTFIMNMVALAPSNFIELSLLGKVMKGAGATGDYGTKLASKGIKVGATGEAAAVANTGFAKYLNTTAGQAMKGLAKGTVAEGMYEENVQFAIEKVNSKYGLKGQMTGDWTNLYKNLGAYGEQMIDNFSDREGQKSILLGGIIGGGGGIISGAKGHIDSEALKDARIEELNKRRGHVRDLANIYEQEEYTDTEGVTKKRIKIGENGEPIINEAAIKGHLADRVKMDDLEEIAAYAEANNDRITGKIMRSQREADWYNAHFEAETTDDLINSIKGWKNMTDEQLLEMGVEVNEKDALGNKLTKDQIIDTKIQNIKRLKTLYDSIEDGILKGSGEQEAAYQLRKHELFQLGNRFYAVNDELKRIELAKSRLEATFPINPIVKQINEDVKRMEALWQAVANPFSVLEDYEKQALELEEQIRAQKYLHRDVLEAEGYDLNLLGEKDNIELIDHPNAYEMAILDAKKAELELVADKDIKSYKDYNHPTKGAQTFSDELFDVGNNRRKASAGEIDYLANEIAFKMWSDKQVKSRIRAQRFADVERKFYSDAVLNRLDQGENVEDVLNDVISLEANINRDAEDALRDAIDDAEVLQKARQARAAAIGDDALMGDTAAQAEIDEINKIPVVNYPSLKGKLTKYLKRDKPDSKVQTEEEVRRTIVQEIIDGSNYVLDNAAKNQDYEDSTEAKSQINRLNALKKVNPFDDLTKKIDKQIAKLEKVFKKLEVRKEDKERQQEIIWDNYTINSYAQLGLNPDGTSLAGHADLVLAMRELIGEDTWNTIIADKDQTAAKAQVLLQLASDSKNTTGKTKLVNAINTLTAKVYKDFVNLAVIDREITKRLGEDGDVLLGMYKLNPERAFNELIISLQDTYSHSGFDKSRDSAVSKFERDRDVVQFITNVKKQDRGTSVVTKAALLEVINLHSNYVSLKKVQERLDTDYDYVTQVQRELNEAKTGVNHTATNQQLVASRDIVQFAGTQRENKPFRAWAYLKGFAGTGKTNVTIRWVMQLLRLKPADIYSVGHNEHSAKGLGESLGNEGHTVAQLEQALRDKNIGDAKFIVLDEVGALDVTTLDLIDTLVVDYNATAKQKVKVIVMGDPNQVTATGGDAIIEGTIHLKNGEHITSITPLTIRYRSNVAAVVDMQDVALDTDEDLSKRKVFAKVNVADLGSNVPLLGSFGTTKFDSDVVKALKGKANDRSKAIIVGNKEEVARYKALLADNGISNVEVLTYIESQGRTIDEVYVNIPKTKSFANDAAYNKGLYTALSRATKFIMVAGLDVTNTVDTEIEAKANAVENNNVKRKDDFIKAREAEMEVIKRLYEGDINEPATKVTPTQEEVEEVPEEVTEDNLLVAEADEVDDILEEELVEEGTNLGALGEVTTPPVEVVPTAFEGEDVKVQYPTYKSLKDVVEEGVITTPGAKANDIVHFVVTQNPSTKVNRIEVMAQVGEGLYRQVAMLGNEEIKGMEPTLRYAIETALADPDSVHVFNESDGALKSQTGQVYPVLSGSIKEATALTYNYGKPEATFSKANLIKKFMGFFNKGNIGQVNPKIAVLRASQIAKIQAATGLKNLKPGVPYAIFENLQQTGTASDGTTQYVRLNPRRLNRQAHADMLDPIFTFMDDVQKFEDLIGQDEIGLGNSGFNKLIQLLADDKDNEAVEQITKLGLTKTPDFIELKNLAKTIDSAIYVKKEVTKEIKGKEVTRLERSPVGEVQSIFNKIANGNFSVDDVVLRVYKKDKKGTFATGKTLLSSTDTKYKRTRKAVEYEQKLEKLFTAEYQRTGIMPENPFKNGKVKNDTVRNITLADLRKLFAFDETSGESTVKGGFGLRMQVPISKFALGREQTAEQLEYYLEDNLESVTPTTIVLDVQKPGQPEGNVTPNTSLEGIDLVFQQNSGLADIGDKTEYNQYLDTVYPNSKVKTIVYHGTKINREAIVNEGFKNNTELFTPEDTDYYEVGELGPGYYFTDEVSYAKEYGSTIIPVLLNNPDVQSISGTDLAKQYHVKSKTEIHLLGSKKDVEGFKAWKKKNGTKRRRNRDEDDDMSSLTSGIDVTSFLEVDGETDLGKTITQEEALEVIRQRIPSITDEEVKFVSRLQIIKLGGIDAWGMFQDGIIYLTTNADGTVYENVAKHEAFHKVVTEFFTDAEYNAIIKIAKNEYNLHGKTPTKVEEVLARKYQEWKGGAKGINNLIANFFKRIARALGFYRENLDTIDKFFADIDRGAFSDNNLPFKGTRFLANIKEHFGNTNNYRTANATLVIALNKYMNEGIPVTINGVKRLLPVTFPEAVEYTKTKLAKHAENYLEDLEDEVELTQHQRNVGEALVKLMQKDKKGKYFLFNAMMKDRYPNVEFKKDFSNGTITIRATEESALEEVDAIERGDVNINDDIAEDDKRNHQNDITQGVKDFLSLVFVKDKVGNEKPLKKNHAYMILMEAITLLDTKDIEKFKKQLDKTLGQKDINKRAVQDKFIKLINTASMTKYEVKVGERIVLRDFPVGASFNNKGEFNYAGVSYSPRGKSTAEFLQEINEATELSYEVLVAMFKQNEAANTFREIITHMNSLREKNVRLGLIDNKDGEITYRYIGLPERGLRQTMKQKVTTGLTRFYKIQGGKVVNPLPSSLLDTLEAAKRSTDQSEKAEAIRKFMDTIGIREEILIDNADTIILDMLGIAERAKGVGAKKKDVDELVDMTEILEDSSSIDNIASLIYATDGARRAASYVAGDGTKRYKWQNSSFALDTLIKHTRDLGKPVHFDTPFFKFNLFTKGGNVIHDYIDHDSIKKSAAEAHEALTQGEENQQQWLERAFMFNFVATVKTVGKKGEKPRYIQNFWTISNKPSAVGAEVNVLSEAEIDKALKLALEQEKNRPTGGVYDLVKTYKSGETFLPGKTPAAIKKHLKERAKVIAQEILDNGSRFDGKLGTVVGKLKSAKLLGKEVELGEFDQRGATLEQILPLVELAYMNYYVNSHFLNQLVVGDQAYYKNEYNIIKRMSVAFAVGMKGMVNDALGMKQHFRMAVGEDIQQYLNEDDFSRFKRLTNLMFNSTDAQGFMTPERYENIQKGFGRGAGLAITLKPVHFEIDEYGIPRAVKYSSIVLTKELVEMFPSLGRLRDKMYAAQVDEFVFESGVKVGGPKTKVKYNPATGEHGEITEDSVIKLSNDFWRIQLNPEHDTDASVANPSQLMYQLNTNNNNRAAAERVYEHVAELNRIGFKDLRVKYGLNSDNVKKVAGKIQTKISAALNPTTDKHTIDLLNQEGISINLPVLSNKVLTAFSSEFSKATVKVRLAGAKLVLQSAYGTSNLLDGRPAPKWRSADGYAEVYMPDLGHLRSKFKIGDEVFLNDPELSTYLGFRIPSTELHSAIPLKIIGFYPSPDNSNIIIAPSEITLFHGSDYDIDALFVVRKEFAEKDYTVGDTVIAKGTVVPSSMIAETKQRMKELGYNRKSTKEQKAEYKLLKEVYSKMLKNAIVEEMMAVVRDKVNEESMMTPISVARFKDMGYGSEETVFDMIARMKKYDAAKPNEADYANDSDYSNAINKWLEGRDSVLFGKRDLNDALDQRAMHQDNFAGNKLTGIFANLFKAVAYTFAGTPEQETPLLKDKFHINFNGITFDRFSRHEIVGKDAEGNAIHNTVALSKDYSYTPTVWETIDTLINAAIDNVNEQILNIVNASNGTGNAYIALTSYGIPINSIVRLMIQPVSLRLSDMKARPSAAVKTLLKEIKGKEVYPNYEQSVYQDLANGGLTDAMLEETYGVALDKMDARQLAIQALALEMLQKGITIGDHLSDTASALKVLQILPVKADEIQNKLDKIAKITEIPGETSTDDKSKLPFTNVDLWNIPHVNVSFTILRKLHSTMEKVFLKHDKRLSKFSKGVISEFGIRLDRKSKPNNNLRVREEFIKYLMTDLYYEVDGVTHTFNTSTEEPYEIEHGGQTRTVYDNEAWSQRLIDRVVEYQNGDGINNEFFNKLEVVSGKYGLRTLKYSSMGSMEAEDIIDYRDFFDAAKVDGKYTQLQRDLVKYAAINQGLSFGGTNYSMLLNPEMFSEISQALDKKIESVLVNTKLEDNLRHHFAMNVAINNPNAVGGFFSRQKGDILEPGVDGDIVYDRMKKWSAATSNEENDLGEENQEGEASTKVTDNNPNLVRDVYDNIYIKLRIPDDKGLEYSYYQQVSRRLASSVYRFDPEILKEGYNVYDKFIYNTTVRAVEDHKPNEDGSKEITLRQTLPETVTFRSYRDPLRLDTVNYRVIESERLKDEDGDETGEVSYKLKEIPTEAKMQKQAADKRAAKSKIVGILNRLSTNFGISYETVDNADLDWAGKFENGKVVINLAKVGLDTPFHEFAHPFVSLIKAKFPILYGNLVNQIKNTEEGKAILARVKALYPELNEADQIEEAIVQAIGEDAAARITSRSLMQAIQMFFEKLVQLIRETIGLDTTITIADLNAYTSLSDLGKIMVSNRKVDLDMLTKSVNLIASQEELDAVAERLTEKGLLKVTCKL